MSGGSRCSGTRVSLDEIGNPRRRVGPAERMRSLPHLLEASRLREQLRHDTVESRRVAVAVDDNGRGLPAQQRERLTEPYVTTRTKGTGLGLAIVKKIMEDHHGNLLLDDRPGGGASVRLVFPVAAPAAAKLASHGA